MQLTLLAAVKWSEKHVLLYLHGILLYLHGLVSIWTYLHSHYAQWYIMLN